MYLRSFVSMLVLSVAAHAQSASTYCSPAALNSTGSSAQIGWQGSLALDQTFTVTCTGLPPRQHALLVYGTVPTNPIPFGNGNLCIHPLHLDPLAFRTTQQGSISVTPDVTSLAHSPNWYFQVMFREPKTPAYFNLSDGLQVSFVAP
jgi:hypothetical protein